MKKNHSFFQSVKCAVKGLVKAFCRERNFLIYSFMIAVAFLVNIVLQISGTPSLFLFVCICGAFSAECLNTEIEKLCDKTEQEHNETIGYIKDISAAAVLWWGIAFFGTEAYLVVEKLSG